MDTRTRPDTLHLRSAFRSRLLVTSQSQVFLAGQALPCITAPCHPSTDETARLTIVFTALAVARYLQNTTGMSIKKIIRALRPLQQITVTIAGHSHHARDPITESAQTILDALGIATD